MSAIDSSYYIQFVKVLFKELFIHRVLIAVAFSVVLLGVVVAGLFYPPVFSTSTTILADQQNIIAPLLRGQAEVTTVQKHAKYVEEVVYSPSLLKKLVVEAGLADDSTSPKQMELLQNQLRRRIKVLKGGPGFIKIATSSQDPSEAFNIVSKASELFIRDASESKRSESREAFQFIDKQVKGYKAQLQEAEERLKKFKSGNLDGTEAGVSGRIATLRAQIEAMELDLEDADTRVRSLERQLKQESQFVARKYRADVYRERLTDAQSRLATLRMSYKETYPDIVALKHQINDLNNAIKEANESDASETDEGGVNPLYEQLRSELSTAKVNVETKKRRLRSTKGLLEEEHKRLKRIAEKEASLAELTRDYNVTKGIYETMLDRKEKARLSMTLDIEGQGVTYKIQEPAVYPLNPTGLSFRHFVMAAPVVAVLLPLGLLIAYILLDPRIRFVNQIEEEVDIPILGVVPRMHTKLSKRVLKSDIILLGLFLFVVFGVFVSILVLRIQGIL